MSGFSGESFNGLTKSDVVNNLTSTSTTQPLSAAQGKALNDYATTYESVTFAPGNNVTINSQGPLDMENYYSYL